MKTTIVLFGFFLALAQCHVSRLEKAGHHHFKKRQVNSGGNKVLPKPVSTPGQKHDCKPTDVCVANGGYCIQSKKEEDCNGLFFPKECKSALCSCCVENKCDSNPCGPNSYCKSTPGSYECICNSGYEKVNGHCEDINECDGNPCGPNSQCHNTDGSYECLCDAGYEKVNGACADINECLSNVCVANSNCTNTPGSYQCTCLPGFTLGQGICEDINECNSTNITCPIDEKCKNTQGSYTCTKKCPADMTYIPLQVVCVLNISGNMTNSEAHNVCSGLSMLMAIVTTNELINFYGDTFLPIVGDSAWVYAAGTYLANGSNCPILTKTANSTVAGLLNCGNKLPYALCFTGVPP